MKSFDLETGLLLLGTACLEMRLGPKAKSLYISSLHSLGKQLENVYTLQTECTTPTEEPQSGSTAWQIYWP